MANGEIRIGDYVRFYNPHTVKGKKIEYAHGYVTGFGMDGKEPYITVRAKFDKQLYDVGLMNVTKLYLDVAPFY